MSNISIGILFAAIGLIIVAVALDVWFVANGSGVVLVAGLVYAYIVAKREAALISYAVHEQEDD